MNRLSAHRLAGGTTVLLVSVAALSACSSDSSQNTNDTSRTTSTLSPDYPVYRTVDALAKASSSVVTVTVGKSHDDVLLPKYEGDDPKSNPLAGGGTPDPQAEKNGALPITVYTVTVNDVIAGASRPGDRLEVQKLGGQKDGTDFKVEGDKPFVEGETYLLFLDTFSDAPAGVVGGPGGEFTRSADGTFVSADATKPLTVSPAQLASLKK